MKKLYTLLFVLVIFSCSSDSEEIQEEQMCCDKTVEEILESYHTMYEEILDREMGDRQRELIEGEYQRKLDNPCESYREQLRNNGVTGDCSNP